MTLHGNDEVRLAMHSPVVAGHPATTLRTAAKVLHGHGVDALAVMERDRIIEPAAHIETVHTPLVPAGPEPGR